MSGSTVEAQAMPATDLGTDAWHTAPMRAIRLWIGRITSAQRLRHDVRALRGLDDRMLTDIGLTRDSLEYAARYGHLPEAGRRFAAGYRHD